MPVKYTVFLHVIRKDEKEICWHFLAWKGNDKGGWKTQIIVTDINLMLFHMPLSLMSFNFTSGKQEVYSIITRVLPGLIFCSVGFHCWVTSKKDINIIVLHWTEADPSLLSKQNTYHMPSTGDSGENRHDLWKVSLWSHSTLEPWGEDPPDDRDKTVSRFRTNNCN